MTTTVSTSDISDQNKNPADKISLFSIGNLATSILAIVALLGLFLTLAGYGIALSVEQEFGIPHATIFKSSFDLLTLSFCFIAWIFNNLSTIFKEILFSIGFLKWVVAIGIAATFVYLLKFFGIIFLKWLAKTTFIKNLAKENKRGSKKQIFANASFLGVFSLIFASLTVPIFLIFGVVILAFASIISTTSIEAGQAHIQKYVIAPKHCRPIRNQTERLDPNVKLRGGADCVKVIQEEKIIASGRVVFSTTELIILYDPISGKATRESLTGRSLIAVSNL